MTVSINATTPTVAFQQNATATFESYVDVNDGVYSWLMPSNLFLIPEEDAIPRSCTYNKVRDLVVKAVGDCSWKIQRDRLECLEHLHYTISWKSLNSSDREMLGRIERAILYGDLYALEKYFRELPDADRERLLKEACSDLKTLGIEVFHVRARSIENGGNVGDHDFVVVIRRKTTIVEIHVDPRVPSTVVFSLNAPWLPQSAVSDLFGDGLPAVDSPDYQVHELQAKKGLESIAIEAALAWAARPKKAISANWQ